MRRLIWKLGRRLYMSARGEPIGRNLPESSGEIYMQKKVSEACADVSVAVIFDIGANIGQWSTQFLKTAKLQRLNLDSLVYHAFEPVPATREKLTANIDAAGLASVANIQPVAMSDRIGEAHINILGSETSGRNSLVDDPLQYDKPLSCLTITTDTLDHFCSEQGIDHVDFVKIDAEGHDFFVIKGASAMLEAERIDVIQFEYTKRWIDSRTFLKDVFSVIDGRPYSLLRIRPDKLELLPNWHPEIERFFSANYALVHDRALAWFDVHHGDFDRANTYA
jgi:FkbM family methyltransferase